MKETKEETLDSVIEEALKNTELEVVPRFDPAEVAMEIAQRTKVMATKKRATKPTISNQDFKEFWNNANSRQEVAEHFEISLGQASAKASQMRANGHELKSFPRGRKKGSGTKAGVITKSVLQEQFNKLKAFIEDKGYNLEEILKSEQNPGE